MPVYSYGSPTPHHRAIQEESAQRADTTIDHGDRRIFSLRAFVWISPGTSTASGGGKARQMTFAKVGKK